MSSTGQASPGRTQYVPHMGGIDVGYKLSSTIQSRPTLVLFVPFTTTVDYYLPEFENRELTDKLNLLAIEPLGHGATRSKSETFTYWDTAMASIQLLDALGLDLVFAMGTSQGGWIAARMALLAPQRVQGIVLVGTSMDYESSTSRELGCWDGPGACSGLVSLSGNLDPMPEFEPGDGYNDFLMDIGYGKGVTDDLKAKWAKTIRDTYHGEDGRKKICMAAINLSTRDGMHARLSHIRCPVLWLQGTDDVVFSVANAEREIKLFTNAPEAKLIPLNGGVHFLSFTHPKELHQNILEFTGHWVRHQSANL